MQMKTTSSGKRRSRRFIYAAIAVAAGAAMAAVPEVSNVTMEQAQDRLVTITYQLSDAPAVVTLDIQTNANVNAAANDPGWTSIGGEVISTAKGDVWKKVSGKSIYTIKWRPDKSWRDENDEGFKIDANGARARVTAWPIDNTPDYMVVDVSAAAQPDTQTYYPSFDFVPGGVTNSLYKTGSLLMRKIMAKDVTWMMGSVAEEGRIATRETSHQVTLTNNYYIGIYPVTLTQWRQVAGYTPSQHPTDLTMAPVVFVSYTDIRQGKGTESTYASATGGVYPAEPYEDSFLGLLRTKTGLDFDLPSEAQWEFAARAGNGEGYWGNGSAMRIAANKDVNLAKLGRYQYSEDGSNRGAIVGSYAPNAWGLYDVHGNVWEWCLDRYADNITGLNGAVKTGSSGNCSQRGGAWSAVAGNCRPAYRASAIPTGRCSTDGFRLLCTAGLQ